MLIKAVIGGQDTGEAALCVTGVGFEGGALGQNRDVSRFRQFERTGESGNSAADNQDVDVDDAHGTSSTRRSSRAPRKPRKYWAALIRLKKTDATITIMPTSWKFTVPS